MVVEQPRDVCLLVTRGRVVDIDSLLGYGCTVVLGDGGGKVVLDAYYCSRSENNY